MPSTIITVWISWKSFLNKFGSYLALLRQTFNFLQCCVPWVEVGKRLFCEDPLCTQACWTKLLLISEHKDTRHPNTSSPREVWHARISMKSIPSPTLWSSGKEPSLKITGQMRIRDEVSVLLAVLVCSFVYQVCVCLCVRMCRILYSECSPLGTGIRGWSYSCCTLQQSTL